MGDVDKVEQQGGFFELLEGGAEGGDELGGEFLDEADCVGEEGGAAGGKAYAASDGIQGGKELVLDEDVGAGEGAHEGGFTGVGVADERDDGDALAGALSAVEGPLLSHFLDLALEAGDALADEAAVGLKLGLAGAAGADAGAEAFEVGPLAAQPGEDVFVLGKLDLEAAFACVGVLREDIEDEGGAVENLDVERLLEVALLGGAEFVVEDDGGVVQFGGLGDDLFELALADVGGRAALGQVLDGLADDFSAGGAGEEGEFFEGGFGAPAAAVSGGWQFAVGGDEEGALGFGGGGVERALDYGVWPLDSV